MHSSIQRLNHLTSLATTYIMILLGLISIASYLALPPVAGGKLEIKDLIIKKGRQRYWGAREEELGSLRFDVQVDLQPLLESYNTKQLFLYLTADLEETDGSATHEVVLWDRIITRGDMRDFRAVGKQPKRSKGSRKGRGKIRLEDGKNKYPFKMPSGSFKNVESANMTLHYSLMPYVGILSSGIAATAQGPVNIPAVTYR